MGDPVTSRSDMHYFALVLFCLVLVKANSPYCNQTNCRTNQTCCNLDSGRPGCCPYKNGTCCGLQNLCCPVGYTCDPIKSSCVKMNNESFTCSSCETVVKAIVAKGCTAACAVLPPPFSLICLGLMKLGLCDEIVEWGNSLNPWKICSSLGMCASGTCSCGYCTRYVYSRCLELPPQHCPTKIQNRYAENGLLTYHSNLPSKIDS